MEPEWKWHPDRATTIAETAVSDVKDLQYAFEKEAGYETFLGTEAKGYTNELLELYKERDAQLRKAVGYLWQIANGEDWTADGIRMYAQDAVEVCERDYGVKVE
jgi:hypothetical protein